MAEAQRKASRSPKELAEELTEAPKPGPKLGLGKFLKAVANVKATVLVTQSKKK